MGHAVDMANRVKNNATLKSKSNKFRKAYFNQTVNLDTKYQFRKPTELELIKSQKSNQKFIQARKKRNLIVFIISLLIGTVVAYFFFQFILNTYHFKWY